MEEVRPEEEEKKGTIRPRGGNVEMLQKDCLDCCASLKEFSLLQKHLKLIYDLKEGGKSRKCKYFQLCPQWSGPNQWKKQILWIDETFLNERMSGNE